LQKLIDKGLEDFFSKCVKCPFGLKLHQNAPKGRGKRQQSGNQSRLSRWQNKCRISQGINFNADFPVKLTLFVEDINVATLITGIPTGIFDCIPGGCLAYWMAIPSPKLEMALKKAGFNLKEYPAKPHEESEETWHRIYLARLSS
jgi:hypothetical protein